MLQQENKYSNRRLKSSFVTTVVSISLVLFMLGLLGMILLHAKKLSNYVKENISLSVILSEDVKEAKIIEFQKKLDITDYVKSTEYITKEQAAEDLSRELGEDFIEFLGYNPLSPTIDLHLKANYANTDSIQKIEKEILANKYVKEVFYQKSLVHLVNDNLRKISYVILGFSVLLLLIAIALINNTIRLSVYARRFLIKSMQLVGATQGYIRRPFVILSIIHGLVSSLIAILLLTGILYLTQTEIPEIIKLQDYKIFLSLFVIMIFLGILFTGISTFFAVKKYLKINNDKIYY